MYQYRLVAFLVVVLTASSASSVAAPAAAPVTSCEGAQEASGTGLAVELVAEGFTQPVHLAAPPGTSDRLFIVEQAGMIRIIKAGKTVSAPFLDIRDRVRSGGERGLLSVAFHPAYAANRRFFVYYTDDLGDLVISEFLTTPNNPDQADASTERRFLAIEHRKYGNHNGGQLVFGPDRFLYIGTGDGGSGGDPDNNAQNLRVLLGKLLRIDVDKPSGSKLYGIPPSNPFLNKKGAPEIWAYGLRNPWRFSFDRGTGDLYLGDVGQNQWEEVDVQPASSAGGENYGWRYMEGSHCFDPPAGCSSDGLTLPVLEYPTSRSAAITGGYVYRGCRMPDLRGTFFYSDYLKGFVRTFVLDKGRATQPRDVTSELTPRSFSGTHRVTSFGEDNQGELYLVEHGGQIYRLVPRK
jgi:glucose/arabinose dehydrogenase